MCNKVTGTSHKCPGSRPDKSQPGTENSKPESGDMRTELCNLGRTWCKARARMRIQGTGTGTTYT